MQMHSHVCVTIGLLILPLSVLFCKYYDTEKVKRFEELRAYLHFNDNVLMKPRDHPDHDRALKVRPVLDLFKKCFIAGMSATEE